MAEASWRVKRGDEEFDLADAAMLRSWAGDGRIEPTDYIYNPVLGRWMYATEVEEIRDIVGSPAKRAELANLNRASLGLGCLGLLLLIVFPPAGIVVLAFALAVSALYHIQRRINPAAVQSPARKPAGPKSSSAPRSGGGQTQ